MGKKTNKSSSIVKLAALGAGAAGLAAAAYIFFGPKGKKNQKQAKAWAVKMKSDVIKKLKIARKVSKPIYHEIIDAVAKEYKKEMKASNGEINELSADLKKHWVNISGLALKAEREMAKDAKKIIKKGRSTIKKSLS